MPEAQILFNIRGQHISREDRFYVVAGSQNYLRAGFRFITSDWENLAKVAIFTGGGESYKIILDTENTALVPWELLEVPGEIQVSAYGVTDGEEVVLATVNSAGIKVYQTGYVADAVNQPDPTPEVWEQILSRLHNIDAGTFTDPLAKIQVRRGNEENFDPDELEEGEIAIALDSRRAWVCFAPGEVEEISLAGDVEEKLIILDRAITTGLASVNGKADANKEDIQNLSGRLDLAEETIGDNADRLESIEAFDSVAQSRLDALENEQDEQGTAYGGLKSRLADVERITDQANDRSRGNEERVKNLESSMITAKHDIILLKNGHTAQEHEIEALQGRATQTEQEIADMKAHEAVWRFHIDDRGHLIETVERVSNEQIHFELIEGRLWVTYG